MNMLNSRKRFSHLWSNEHGAVLPLVGLAFVSLLLVTGFAVDYARAQMVKDRLQWALDAAALGGANAASTGDLARVRSEGMRYLSANFPNGFMGAARPN